MALAVTRNPDTVAAAVLAWLRTTRDRPDLELVAVDAASAGLSSETLLLEIRDPAGPDAGEGLVVRLPPVGPGTFPVYDLHLQAVVQDAVARHGIPAPSPVVVEDDDSWLDTPFLVMPRIPGHVAGVMVALDDFVTGAAEAVQLQFQQRTLDLLARIHRIDWRRERLDDVVPVRDLDAELGYWARYLEWYADGEVVSPRLTATLDWCRNRRPAHEPPHSLLWGDVRYGNVIYDDDRRPTAVIDWEMATIGAAEHDIAWMLALETMQDGFLGRGVPGFLDHDDAAGYYAAHLGRELQNLPWYEVFALVRSLCLFSRINILNARAGARTLIDVADNPLLDHIERRIAEYPRGG